VCVLYQWKLSSEEQNRRERYCTNINGFVKFIYEPPYIWSHESTQGRESRPMGSVESDLRMCSLASLRTQWPPSCFLNEAIRKRTWLVRFTCVQDRMPNPRPLTFNTPPLTRGRFSKTFTAIRSQTPTLSNIEIKKCLGVTTYCIMFLCYLSTLWLQSLRPKAIIKYRNIIFKRVSRNYDLKMRHLK